MTGKLLAVLNSWQGEVYQIVPIRTTGGVEGEWLIEKK